MDDDMPAAPRRGRPREAGADEQIRRATLEIIREQGPRAVSVASVSGRTGLARTTIYRRYQDRRALLAAALEPVTDRGEPPPDLTLREKLAWLLCRTEEVLDEGIGRGGVAAVLTDSDPEFSSALRGCLEAGLRPVREHIASDITQGTLVPGLDPDLLINLILGSYLAESLRHGTPGERWRDRTARQLGATLDGAGTRGR